MTAPELRRARIAVLGYFFVLGAATATWAARLPAIKASLHLSDGGLGLALFAVPAGSVLTLVMSGRIVDAFGAPRVLRIAGLLLAAALVTIGLGPATRNLPVLVAALVWYGAVAGLLDVSMNTCGARLEAGYGRPIMSSLHAGYSIAGLAGAGIGGIFAWLALGPLPTFAAVAVPLVVLVLLASRWVTLPPVTPQAVRPGDPPPHPPLPCTGDSRPAAPTGGAPPPRTPLALPLAHPPSTAGGSTGPGRPAARGARPSGRSR
jgi:MFS family permease